MSHSLWRPRTWTNVNKLELKQYRYSQYQCKSLYYFFHKIVKDDKVAKLTLCLQTRQAPSIRFSLFYPLTLSTATSISLSLRVWADRRWTISETRLSVIPGEDFSTRSNALRSSSMASLRPGPCAFECLLWSCSRRRQRKTIRGLWQQIFCPMVKNRTTDHLAGT